MDKKKVTVAEQRIVAAISKHNWSKVFVGHSGGKDSCVVHHLAKKMLAIGVMVVHNVKPMLGTSGDPVAALTEMHPETLEFLYSNVCKGTEVHMLHSGIMSCFVEDEGLQLQIDGARVSEYNRPGKSSDFIRNGVNVNRKNLTSYEPVGIFGLSICYPIFDWTDEDVFDYLDDNQLPFSKEYMKNGEYDSWKWKKING